MSEEEYKQIRDNAIQAFGKCYKNTLAFDMCCLDKQTRVKLLEDEYYISETKKYTAKMYSSDLGCIQTLISQVVKSKDPLSSSATLLKCLEMKNKLLFEDMDINNDDSKALNVNYIALSRADFESMPSVEYHAKDTNSDALPSDFAGETKTGSFADRMKEQVDSRLKSQSSQPSD